MLIHTVKIHTKSRTHSANTLEKNPGSSSRGVNVHAHTHIFALADTLTLKTQKEEGEGGTEAMEHTTKSKQTALSYELS